MAIIEEIFQGITKEVNQVKNLSQDMLQTFNLNNQIKDLERKRLTILIDIGRYVLNKFNKNDSLNEEEIKLKVKDINKIDDEIFLLNEELNKIKAQNDPNAPASQKAKAKAGYRTTPGSKCKSCKSDISLDKNFCPVCGERIDISESESSDSSENPTAKDNENTES